jgi:heme-degrading monooxygenase HmoA
MIARTRYGAMPVAAAQEYLQRLRTVGLRDYLKMDGNRGAFVLERLDGDVTNLGLLSFWDSLESIEGYAGDDWLGPTLQHHAVYADRLEVGNAAKVARAWHGAVPLDKSGAYLELMRTIALDDYERVTGNQGAFVLHRTASDVAHFTMLTFWESLEAIARFAGRPVDRAKYYDFDPEYLLEMEPKVLHYDVYGLKT